jgi:tetratricopeptide (TPR) repeat protein
MSLREIVFQVAWPISDEEMEAVLRDPFVWYESSHSLPASRRSDRSPLVVLNRPQGPVIWEAGKDDGEIVIYSDIATRKLVCILRFPETPAPNVRLRAELLAIHERLQHDRETAAERVNTLLLLDGQARCQLTETDPRYRTLAVVQGILASVATTPEDPSRCLELTGLATEVAGALSELENHPIHVAQARCDAWREHAWALLCVGRYPMAVRAAAKARMFVERFPALAIEQALAMYVEASGLERKGSHAKCVDLAQRAAHIFLDHGDKERYVKARLLEGFGLFYSKRFEESVELWTSLVAQAGDNGDRAIVACLYANIGGALREIGRLDLAGWYLRHALTSFESLEPALANEIPRVKLGIARISAKRGQFERAIKEMRAARFLFAKHRMAAGVAAADLDIVEILLLLNRTNEAEKLCTALPAVFESFGMTTNALEAAAYLKECAAERTLDMPRIQHVRDYLGQLPRNPRRRFLRPEVEAGA